MLSDSYASHIFQAIRDPLLILGDEFRVTLVNRSFYKLFHTKPEQTEGRRLEELGDGQWNIPALHQLLENLATAADGEFNDFQVQYDFPGIGQRTMLLNARRFQNGEDHTKLILLAIEDTTQRWRAEHHMQASEIRYRRLFEAAHDGILILNASTRRITDVNPFMLELLGFEREYFLGKELWEIGIFRDKAANQAAMLELHKNGSVRFENLPLQDRNGRRHPVEIVANVYQEDRQSVIQCNIRDIGERVQFEREREALLGSEQASRMEAEAANRSKDLFLATLSHEVRTPLNAIMGWASILRGDNCTAEETKEGMEVIERNCKAQAQLIEDVLDISRIISGKMQLQISSCELTEVIKGAIHVVQPAANAKDIRIETQFDLAASPASLDANRIRQVVWNLLINAIKFSPKGNVVKITLARERSSAKIEVIDGGLGIKADFLPYLFDRFRQADSSTRRKQGGLGLGLSIVKHIVELHGGTVHAASGGENRGATFTVYLPVRAVHGIETDIGKGGKFHTPPALDMTSVRLDGLRLLIVDDEADALRLLTKVLGEAGAIVTVASSVAEALKVVEREHPQMLLSDIAMPDQDGYDLIRKLRSDGHLAKDLPAVALTAFAHRDDRLRVLLAGFQLHVAKPIDPHELITVLGSLAGRTGAVALSTE
jgi:PAS domain S-box-containing protein